MVTRNTRVAVVGLAVVLLSGACTRPAPEPRATVSDENQIRSVIARVAQAHAASDYDHIAPLTCTKFLDQIGTPSSDDVPPMNALPLEIFSTMSPEELAKRLGTEYAGASPDTLRRLAEALISKDEAAYTEAMAEVMLETMEVRIDKFENLKIDGDNATVDASLVIGTGGKTSYTTDVTQFELVKEDGRWKDCSPQ